MSNLPRYRIRPEAADEWLGEIEAMIDRRNLLIANSIARELVVEVRRLYAEVAHLDEAADRRAAALRHLAEGHRLILRETSPAHGAYSRAREALDKMDVIITAHAEALPEVRHHGAELVSTREIVRRALKSTGSPETDQSGTPK